MVPGEMSRIGIHAAFLAIGMMMFSMVAMGLFQTLGLTVMGVAAALLIVGGVCLRRSLWSEWRVVLGVGGLALLIFFLPVLAMSSGAFSTAWGVMMMIYLPFYWLPFIVGLMAGGLFKRSRRVVEQAS